MDYILTMLTLAEAVNNLPSSEEEFRKLPQQRQDEIRGALLAALEYVEAAAGARQIASAA
jgi:hypothetical protein